MSKARVIVNGAIVCIALALPASASATTFCVPGFHAACPDGGGNVAATLATALSTNHSDGQADEIVIASGSYAAPGTWETQGTDPIVIRGVDKETTILTSSGTTHIPVLSLIDATVKPTVLRDVTVSIPFTFPDSTSAGWGISVDGSTLINVDVMNNNDSSNSGGVYWYGGGSWTGGRIYTVSSFPLSMGLWVIDQTTEQPSFRGLSIESVRRGIVTDMGHVGPSLASFDRIHIDRPDEVAIRVRTGQVRFANSVFVTGGAAVPVVVRPPGVGETTLHLDHLTIVRASGDTPWPFDLEGNDEDPADVNLVVRNSIVHGFDQAYTRWSSDEPEHGDANITITNSRIAPGADDNGGKGTVTLTNNNHDDPGFVGSGDFRLAPGSAMIDRAPAVLLTGHDFLGVPRPQDGNRDGTARADLGAYEVGAPPPNTKIGKGPGKKAKKVKRGKRGVAKFKITATERQSTFQCRIKGDKKWKKWRKCKSNQKFRLKPKKRAYTLLVRATNQAGFTDPTPARKKFKVRQAK